MSHHYVAAPIVLHKIFLFYTHSALTELLCKDTSIEKIPGPSYYANNGYRTRQ